MGEIQLSSNEVQVIDIKLHMAVKTLAIIQGEINCKLDELIKKAKLLQEKEGEGANYLLKMLSDNLNELVDLCEQRNNLQHQIENLKTNEKDLIKE